jgi:predicted dehydrogenase
MGRVHTQAYARVLHHFPELTVAPELVAVADEVPGVRSRPPRSSARDSHQRLAGAGRRPAVEAVSVTAPNFLHCEIGVAMAQAGKHTWIEKPVGPRRTPARRERPARPVTRVYWGWR